MYTYEAEKFTILRILAGQEWMYRIELIHASDGKLKRGSIDLILTQMVDQGWVETREEDEQEVTPGSALRKHLYKITA